MNHPGTLQITTPSDREIVMTRASLETPLRTSNPRLSAMLEETGTSVFPPEEKDVIEEVRRAIAAALHEGDARLVSIARKLGTSER